MSGYHWKQAANEPTETLTSITLPLPESLCGMLTSCCICNPDWLKAGRSLSWRWGLCFDTSTIEEIGLLDAAFSVCRLRHLPGNQTHQIYLAHKHWYENLVSVPLFLRKDTSCQCSEKKISWILSEVGNFPFIYSSSSGTSVRCFYIK